MNINYMDRQYSIPNSLHSITLEQWIKWKENYGNALDAKKKEIDLMPDSSDKDVEAFLLLSDAACKFFSFYTGIELEEMRTNFDVNQLINVYTSSTSIMTDEQFELDIEPEYIVNNSIWNIIPPIDFVPEDGLMYDSFLELKKMVIQLKAFSEGDWNKLPALCAMYLRKKGETAADINNYLEERHSLMQQLPLNIAFSIAKYLEVTLKVYTDTLNTKTE
ncbi:hypothetical protein F0919_17920 [Taibaiella lutea]|uniref:Uncharacterized protein n=1 Tax=Taibaiella lutea TaxID=2608001 RepID=A0A5M6CHU3_9BACT|nr:hypothetical protein [Taibaiella lutea]KAA5532659.1 hypothetical protein F0919_17920 [Taibaiella lutea]